jgi:hypothetical protein
VLCIVPLAGPDFHDPAYGVKPFVRVGEETLIEATLGRRAWLRNGQLKPADMVFVLRDTAHTGDAAARLTQMFPGSRFVYVSDGTGGALLSALAGACFARDGSPLVVDLVDLAFDADESTAKQILSPGGDGFIPWFRSSDPVYSYLRFDGDCVVETAEKRVISGLASAGVYTFATAAHFLRAAAGCLSDPAYRVNGALFLCPAYNVLIGQGARIEGGEVSNVLSYSKQFHARRTLQATRAELAVESTP